MSEWKTIDTAPKDGTEIIIGRFIGDNSHWDGKISIDWYRLPEDKRGFNGWGSFNETFPATHWMPAPKPPVTKSTVGSADE